MLPEIVDIRLVKVSDVIRRKLDLKQEKNLSADHLITDECIDTAFIPPPIMMIRAPSYPTKSRNRGLFTLKSLFSSRAENIASEKEAGAIQNVKMAEKDDIICLHEPTNLPNQSWSVALSEGVNILAAIQMVDRGEERNTENDS